MSTDIHALVGAYAVDALDDLERAQFERHLAECPACQAEVAGLQEAAGVMGSLATTPPPASLRDSVLAGITTVRPLPPEVPMTSATAPAHSGRSRFRPRLLVAAAAAVIVVGGGATAIVQPWQDDSSQVQLSAGDRVRAASDAETYTQSFPDGSKATLVRSRSQNAAVLTTVDMADAPTGSIYELWLIHDDQMVPAGLMNGGDHEVLLEGDAASANGFGITVEPDGGSDAPTSDPIVAVEFENA
ncbi:anti-sigma factor [Nocardioides aestuarii]|uniref:Regulator of SigK n=1 Tax=Nocardioides aestuarii TaxID=252231 RepID=A0ABW4TMY3_9ACTN